MGCGGSKKFSSVEAATGMSAKEVSASFRAFKKEAGGKKKINIGIFNKMVAGMNTNKDGDVTDYARHLFRVMDTDRDGLLTFEEVIIGFHHLSAAGEEKEKLKIVFQIYDVDNTKALSRDNVRTITLAQSKLHGSSLSVDEIEEKVNNFFSQCDLNEDGKITQEEFLKAGKSISEMFELDD